MTSVVVEPTAPRWLVSLATAARRTLLQLGSLVELHSLSWWEEALEETPYHADLFHTIGDVVEVTRRGYAQCADAAAILSAVTYALGHRHAWVCIEAPQDMHGYSHARVIVDGRAIDVYADRRPEGLAPSCEWRVDVVDLLQMPLHLLRLTPVVGARP